MPEENKDGLLSKDETNLESVVSTTEVKGEPLTLEAVQELIKKAQQSEGDRVRTEYSKKLKSLETEKETLLKEKMTEDEKTKFELENARKEIQERENVINQRTLELSTISLLKDENVPIEFKPYVIGNDEESTKSKVKAFKKLWDAEINKAVEDKFKSNSRTPNQSSEGLTMERINKMSTNEINANWDQVSKVLENNRR